MRGLLTPAFAARLDRHERTSVRQTFGLSILGLGSLLECRVSQNSNYNCEVGAILLSRLSDVNPQNCEGFATRIKL